MKRKHTIVDYMDRQEQAQKNNKIKSMTDFDEEHTNSINLWRLKKNQTLP